MAELEMEISFDPNASEQIQLNHLAIHFFSVGPVANPIWPNWE